MRNKLIIKSRYGIAPDRMLNNPEISLKAKGLFVYLQSKPDGWRFSVDRISQQQKGGETIVRNAVRELEEKGCLIRKAVKNEKGQWDGYDYILGENPSVENLSTVFPSTGSLDTLSKTDNSKIDNSKKEEEISSFKKKGRPFFRGEEMRLAQGKWWVIPKEGGQWLEFAGSLSDIEWKKQ